MALFMSRLKLVIWKHNSKTAIVCRCSQLL